MSKSPHFLLGERVRYVVLERLQELLEEEIGDSPIEKLFADALRCYAYAERPEYLNVSFNAGERREEMVARDPLILFVDTQVQLPGWRVDFMIHALAYGPRFPERSWRKLIVECDGHDFHAVTKEQAARDRRRDRFAQEKGYTIYRFTGSELWRDPWKCAEDVFGWAAAGLA